MSNFHSGTRPLHGDSPTSWTWFGSSMKASLASQFTHVVFALQEAEDRRSCPISALRIAWGQTSSSQGHAVPKTRPVLRTSGVGVEFVAKSTLRHHLTSASSLECIKSPRSEMPDLLQQHLHKERRRPTWVEMLAACRYQSLVNAFFILSCVTMRAPQLFSHRNLPRIRAASC